MSSRQRKHQLERRAQGLCVVEGCEVVTGKAYRCLQHRREHRIAVRKARSGVSVLAERVAKLEDDAFKAYQHAQEQKEWE